MELLRRFAVYETSQIGFRFVDCFEERDGIRTARESKNRFSQAAHQPGHPDNGNLPAVRQRFAADYLLRGHQQRNTNFGSPEIDQGMECVPRLLEDAPHFLLT